MDALLRVVTKVGGAEQLSALGARFKGLESAASRLTNVSGLLGGALGSLAPLATIGGLTALVGKTIETADQMHNLSMRTGVTVENLGKLKKAAALSGTDIETVSTALLRLSKAMAASVSTSRFGEMTKEEVDQAVQSVRDGERTQTRIINEQADERINALQRETDRRLGEISKRYRREEQLINDQFDDAADAAAEAEQDRADAQIKQINRFYDYRRKVIRDDQLLTEQAKEFYLQSVADQEDAALEAVRDATAQQAKARQRAARDERQAVLDAVEERKSKEQQAIKDKIENEKKTIKDGADYQIEQTRLASEAQQAAFKKMTGASELSQQMEEMGLSGKGASKAFQELGISVMNASGKMKNPYTVMLELFDALRNIDDQAKRTDYTLKLFGRGGAQLAEMMNMGGSAIDNFRASIDTAFAGMADKYKDQLVTLGGQVGRIGVEITRVVLPALEMITPYIVGFLQAFNNLDGPVKTAIGALAILAIGITSLSFVLVPLIMLFTGPAGIVVAIGLGIAAVVALAVAFKDKLGGLPAFVLEIMQAVANPIGAALKLILDLVGKLFSALAPLVEAAVKKLWKWLGDRFNDLGKLIGGLADGAGKILGSIGNAVRDAFMAIPNLLRSAVNGTLSWAGNAVNSVIGLVNSLIRGVNQAAAAVRLPGIPEIPYVSVPQFATGGYVTGPTLGVIGEGGQPEYIIPASRMADASASYLGGARGAEVLNGTGGAGAGVRPGITIQTGPVLQQPDGSRWVSMEDLERGMAMAVDQALGIVASPAGRMALGGA
jgi:hypothetical protein